MGLRRLVCEVEAESPITGGAEDLASQSAPIVSIPAKPKWVGGRCGTVSRFYRNRAFAYERHAAAGAMIERQEFVKNQVLLASARRAC